MATFCRWLAAAAGSAALFIMLCGCAATDENHTNAANDFGKTETTASTDTDSAANLSQQAAGSNDGGKSNNEDVPANDGSAADKAANNRSDDPAVSENIGGPISSGSGGSKVTGSTSISSTNEGTSSSSRDKPTGSSPTINSGTTTESNNNNSSSHTGSGSSGSIGTSGSNTSTGAGTASNHQQKDKPDSTASNETAGANAATDKKPLTSGATPNNSMAAQKSSSSGTAPNNSTAAQQPSTSGTAANKPTASQTGSDNTSSDKQQPNKQTPSTSNKATTNKAAVTLTIIGNKEWGSILNAESTALTKNDRVSDVLIRAAKSHRFVVDIRGKGALTYVAGIDGLYEFDDGPLSGWKYRVNGVVPDIGAGSYELKSGDQVEWFYTSEDETLAEGTEKRQ